MFFWGLCSVKPLFFFILFLWETPHSLKPAESHRKLAAFLLLTSSKDSFSNLCQMDSPSKAYNHLWSPWSTPPLLLMAWWALFLLFYPQFLLKIWFLGCPSGLIDQSLLLLKWVCSYLSLFFMGIDLILVDFDLIISLRKDCLVMLPIWSPFRLSNPIDFGFLPPDSVRPIQYNYCSKIVILAAHLVKWEQSVISLLGICHLILFIFRMSLVLCTRGMPFFFPPRSLIWFLCFLFIYL